MVYEYCSSEEVIAQLMGRIKLTDATYADDLLNWLRDGINMLRLRQIVTPAVKIITINNHIGCIPCGTVHIDGIVYKGQRLRIGTGKVDARINDKNCKFLASNSETYFAADVNSDGYTKNEQSYLLLRGDDLKGALDNCTTGAYYVPCPNHIQTSFEEGCVTFYYRKMPVDDNGYPLIPDEENLKFGLGWFLMAMLSMGGYKHADARHDYSFCMRESKHWIKKGKGIIKYPSTDQREAHVNLRVNLIPPYGYYEKFMIGGEQPKFVNK